MALFTTAVDSLRREISQHMFLIKRGLNNFAVKIKYIRYINTILGLAVYILYYKYEGEAILERSGQEMCVPEG
jgi:hypothetical protein